MEVSMLLQLMRWLLAFWLCMASSAHAQMAPRSSLSSKDVELLRAMVPAMAASWKAKDAKGYASQFAADAEHINAYGMWWQGRSEIAEAMTFVLHKIYPSNPIAADSVTVKGLSPGVAVVQYRWQLQPYSDPDGTRYAKPWGRVTQVVIKRREGWRISHFQSTFINPAVRHIR